MRTSLNSISRVSPPGYSIFRACRTSEPWSIHRCTRETPSRICLRFGVKVTRHDPALIRRLRRHDVEVLAEFRRRRHQEEALGAPHRAADVTCLLEVAGRPVQGQRVAIDDHGSRVGAGVHEADLARASTHERAARHLRRLQQRGGRRLDERGGHGGQRLLDGGPAPVNLVEQVTARDGRGTSLSDGGDAPGGCRRSGHPEGQRSGEDTSKRPLKSHQTKC